MYEINFKSFSHGSVTSWIHTKNKTIQQFKELKKMNRQEINIFCGLDVDTDIIISYIILMDNKGNIIGEIKI